MDRSLFSPVCKNWSRLRLNANSVQNVSKWEDIGHITMVSISCNHMSYHTTKLFQKDIDVLGKMCCKAFWVWTREARTIVEAWRQITILFCSVFATQIAWSLLVFEHDAAECNLEGQHLEIKKKEHTLIPIG